MTAPNKNEGLIRQLLMVRSMGARKGKHWNPDGPEAARAIQDLEADLSEALKHLKAMSHVVPRPFEVEAAHAFLERLASTADG